jgi:large subunit ribosomal protein L9
MYVILTQDVPQLGSKNSLVNVADGYFNNFLLPKGLARYASASMIDTLRDQIVEQKERAAKTAKAGAQHATELKGAEITLSGEASEKGTLFKALTDKDVIEAVKEKFGFALEKKALTMDHLKKVGEHAIAVNFGEEQVEMKVIVEAST